MEDKIKNSYNGKRVLVIGADGFMGSHLTERLLEYNAKVSVFIHNENLKNLSHVKEKLKTIVYGDLSNKEATELIIKELPQIIFHLAVSGYIPDSIKDPRQVNKINLDGTLNVLEAIRKLKSMDAGLERLVYVSSCVVYGARDHPIKETEEFRPSTPYAASKAAADSYCYSYLKTYGLPISIARPFNVYGPRHPIEVTSLFSSLALDNKEIKLEGGGKATRDFTYVDDMVDAFLIMGTHEKAVGEVINFGSGKEISIKELAKKIIDHTNSNSKVVETAERPGQDLRLLCDNTRANQLFDWRPKISIDEGLKKTIEWIKSRT